MGRNPVTKVAAERRDHQREWGLAFFLLGALQFTITYHGTAAKWRLLEERYVARLVLFNNSLLQDSHTGRRRAKPSLFCTGKCPSSRTVLLCVQGDSNSIPWESESVPWGRMLTLTMTLGRAGTDRLTLHGTDRVHCPLPVRKCFQHSSVLFKIQ